MLRCSYYLLDAYRAADRLNRTRERRKYTITRCLEDATGMFRNRRIQNLRAQPDECSDRSLLVGGGQLAESSNICDQNSSEATFHGVMNASI
jgi:hypothetical protein